MLLLHCHRISTPQCRVVIYCTRGRGRSHHLSACSRTAESNKCESAVGVTTRRGCERCRNANGPEQKKNGRYITTTAAVNATHAAFRRRECVIRCVLDRVTGFRKCTGSSTSLSPACGSARIGTAWWSSGSGASLRLRVRISASKHTARSRQLVTLAR